ncbi:hypothetical protein [Nocardia sp. BMG111209]|uniref:hypothetical protein n=1 Tax=Nocardia sp. BMG111209 TaxID=1160137 RepID=UPI00035F529C|nr:hypothetical protein [Nocardia sp. BMG111209]
MVYPVAFGWIQTLLIAMVVLALALFVLGFVRMRKVGRGALARHGSGGIVLILLAGVVLWGTTLLQTYLGLTGEVKAAHVVATPVAGTPHSLDVDLTLFGDRGHAEQHQKYRIEGDMWVLQADIVELQHWVNTMGFHSGYQVTRLFGERLDGVAVKQNQTFVGGSDENFFNDMQQHSWYTKPFVRSAYGNAVIATTGSWDVYISQDAIKTRPA